MALVCDVCKCEVSETTQFCPQCGLEIVPERERASRPPPMEKDVFDWETTPGKPKQYDVTQEQKPDLELDRSIELLQLAETRVGEGQILDASALIKQLSPAIKSNPKYRPRIAQIDRVIEARKQSIRERSEAFADAGDSDRLVTLLAGQAANEMEPEEICAIALKAAQTLFQARQAESAAEILRLAPFRTIREEALVLKHRELELRVHDMRSRQHATKSMLIVGGASAAGVVGLFVLARIVWSGSLAGACWFLIPALLIAAGLVFYMPQIRGNLEKRLSQSAGRGRAADKLQSFLDRKRRP